MRTGPKALVGLGLPAALRPHTPDKGGGASRYASYPAPAGWRWDFLYDRGVALTDRGVPLVELVRV